MIYFHRYCSLYPLPPATPAASTQEALLKLAILSLALKSVFQDYIVEHLSISAQLGLFEVTLPKKDKLPSKLPTAPVCPSLPAEPDLFQAKLEFEEQVKDALQYEMRQPLP